MRAVPKKRKEKGKMRLTRFYCSKCRVDNAEHGYEDCPTWKICGFCDKIGHWGFHCPHPHVKCTRLRCGVHVGHRNIGDMCPWSRETKVHNFRYACNGQICDLAFAKTVYGEGLDWDSYNLSI
jgi:hypothetical protein